MTTSSSDETWVVVPGYENYRVSSTGQVLSYWHSKPRLLTRSPNRDGYLTVGLVAHGGRSTTKSVHEVVASAFLGPRPAGSEGEEIRHLDGDRRNNRADNLRYGSRSQNRWDAVRHGTHHNASKSHCPHGHPYDEANTLLTPAGHRRCRACKSESDRRVYRSRRSKLVGAA